MGAEAVDATELYECDNAMLTKRTRTYAPGGAQCGELGEAAQVLCDGGKRELELRSIGATQSQAIEELVALADPDPLWRSSLSIDARSVATRWRRLLAAQTDSILAKFGSGRTMELGRSRRTIDHAAAGARTDLRGHRQRAASKDHRYRGTLTLFGAHLYPLTRGRSRPAGAAC